MIEEVYCFGLDEGLVGVLTEPAAAQRRRDAPVLIFLNSGVLHSAGPFGWYVTLARRFADQGVASFRFDISGVGDSPPRTDGQGSIESGVADATSAMDLLGQVRGARKFVLLGLCSGAILAQRLAATEDRVSGAVLIDGWGYKTLGFHLRSYGRRILNGRTWVRTLGRLIPGRKPALVREGSSLEDRRLLIREYYFEFPDKERGRAQLAAARRRGARLLFVFTGDRRYFNHRRQFEEMVGRLAPGDAIEFDYLPEADHLLACRESRQALFHRVENWFQRIGEPRGSECHSVER